MVGSDDRRFVNHFMYMMRVNLQSSNVRGTEEKIPPRLKGTNDYYFNVSATTTRQHQLEKKSDYNCFLFFQISIELCNNGNQSCTEEERKTLLIVESYNTK